MNNKGMAISTASYIHFARQLLNPTTTTKKYKVIEVNDYSRDIENSIKTIDEANSLLYKTDQQIDTLISQVKYEFQDYIGVFGECDQLLNNLYRIKNDLREKEYEMEKIKKAQERELEKNNAKVLTRGEYPM